jgi:orotate phosphoribosyltransferase
MSGPLQRGLLDLMRPRKGHFRLESGYHGELWLDLDSLFLRPRLLEPFAVELARRVSAHDVDAVCGPLEGGAFLAQMIARELDLEFFYSARSAPPRGEGLYTVGYRLPAALRGAASGRRFGIVDDVVSAGSAVRGTSADLRACGAEPVVAGALLVLTSPASGPAPLDLPLERIEVLRSAIWAPSECPRCVALEPLENSLG